MQRRFIPLCLLAILTLSVALAHDTRTVGEPGSEYKLIVGMLNEPVFTEMRTGLDLTVLNADDDSPVENLENSLIVTITAPDGTSTRTLELRPQHNQPGHYTDDYILTQPGTYTIRVTGYIGSLHVDEAFEREVGDVAELRFP